MQAIWIIISFEILINSQSNTEVNKRKEIIIQNALKRVLCLGLGNLPRREKDSIAIGYIRTKMCVNSTCRLHITLKHYI